MSKFVNLYDSAYESWQEGKAKTITFIVTEDCQLRCRYCYLIGKNKRHVMEFDIARRTVDYLLREKELFNDNSVIWEFIGGEPFLEIELIDKISDYIKTEMYRENHKWFDNYRFSFSTNGILYDSQSVQKYISKNKTHVSIGITIDGTRAKHDLQRVYPDGRGSYDDIVRNIPLWLEQFPDASTKVTIASEDIPYIRESVLHLWDLGIQNVNINVVFEDVWQPGDDELFEQQLKTLADDIVDNNLYEKFRCSFFTRNIGQVLKDNQNWCGAGKMLSVDHKGEFFPCTRFARFALRNRPERIIGNCYDGIDFNKLRPFFTLDRKTQSPQECLDCEIASGCAWCQAANYDFADSDTIYQRVTYLCDMHRARVRANKYFWDNLDKKLRDQTGELSNHEN